MVALSRELVEVLGDVVADVREAFEAGVWAVNEALALHSAFTDNNVPRSALVRAIVVREFRAAAERRGLFVRTGLGGAVELYELNGSGYAIIRLRGAEAVGDEMRVIANSGSTWGGISDDGLWRESPYVLGFLTSDNDSIEFFIAEVTGQTETTVAHLEFGWMHVFAARTPDDDGSFIPDSGDSLDGWDLPEEDTRANEA